MVHLRLYQLWHLTGDPTDTSNPYTPYTFSTGNMQLDVGIARRESVTTIPGVDGVADGYGSRAGPLEDRILTYTCLVPTAGGPEAARDRLMAALMGTQKVRLVAQADDNTTLWFTTGKLIRLDLVLEAEQAFRFTFKATWRIRADWRPRFNETAEVFRRGSLFVTGSTFGGLGVTTINSNPKTFTIDATGTPGVNLPTLPDRATVHTIHGPVGDDGGFTVANNTATSIDAGGNETFTYFGVPIKLATADDTVSLDFGSQRFTHTTAAGVTTPFRPSKPAYQSEYFRVDAGIVNACTFSASGFGGTVLTGGSIKVSWTRKKA